MLLFANNAESTLKNGIGPSDVTIHLADGTGARFPVIGGGSGNTFFLTLVDALGNVEIVEATARAGDVLTVLRARDGTTAKTFPAGSVADHRLVAEAIRRISPEAKVGQPNGLAPLDGDSRIPLSFMPLNMLNQTLGDARYVQLTTANVANGYAMLDAGAKLPGMLLPANVLLTTVAAATYIPASQKGAASGVATLDENGHLLPGQRGVDMSLYALKASPTFTGDVSVANRVSATLLTVTGVSTLNTVNASDVSTTGVVTIKGGGAYGKRTYSTSTPSGTPAVGDEWIQYAA